MLYRRNGKPADPELAVVTVSAGKVKLDKTAELLDLREENGRYIATLHWPGHIGIREVGK